MYSKEKEEEKEREREREREGESMWTTLKGRKGACARHPCRSPVGLYQLSISITSRVNAREKGEIKIEEKRPFGAARNEGGRRAGERKEGGTERVT